MNLIEASAALNDQVRKEVAAMAQIMGKQETINLPASIRSALLETVKNYQFVKEKNIARQYARNCGSIYETKTGQILEIRPAKGQIAKVYFWEILAKEKASNNAAPFPWENGTTRRVLQIETPTRVLFSLPHD
jgi:hypothetical protein